MWNIGREFKRCPLIFLLISAACSCILSSIILKKNYTLDRPVLFYRAADNSQWNPKKVRFRDVCLGPVYRTLVLHCICATWKLFMPIVLWCFRWDLFSKLYKPSTPFCDKNFLSALGIFLPLNIVRTLFILRVFFNKKIVCHKKWQLQVNSFWSHMLLRKNPWDFYPASNISLYSIWFLLQLFIQTFTVNDNRQFFFSADNLSHTILLKNILNLFSV